MVASWLGVAGMAGTCIPLARVFQSHVSQAADARQLAIALAAFAPGLLGYGLTANLSRVLYADGRSRASALAVSGGWLLVIVADLLIVPFVPRSAVVPWLGAGTTIGLTASGVALLILVRRFRGPDALRGCARAALAGLAGALAGAAAGLGVSASLRTTGFLPNVAVTLLASAAVLVAFLAVLAVADGGDLRAVLRRVIRRMKVAFVLGTSTGGTARHVRMLAGGCAARGVPAEVFGPAQTERDFAFRAVAHVGFTPVDIADRPRVRRDLRAIARLRRLTRRLAA